MDLQEQINFKRQLREQLITNSGLLLKTPIKDIANVTQNLRRPAAKRQPGDQITIYPMMRWPSSRNPLYPSRLVFSRWCPDPAVIGVNEFACDYVIFVQLLTCENNFVSVVDM